MFKIGDRVIADYSSMFDGNTKYGIITQFCDCGCNGCIIDIINSNDTIGMRGILIPWKGLKLFKDKKDKIGNHPLTKIFL